MLYGNAMINRTRFERADQKGENEAINCMIEQIEGDLSSTNLGLVGLLRNALEIKTEYEILFIDTQAYEEFCIAKLLGLPETARAGFLDSGSRSSSTIRSARKSIEVETIGSSRESAYSYVPKCEWIPYNISFLHLTTVNELQGNRLSCIPISAIPILLDMSADLFYSPARVESYDLIYACDANEFMPKKLCLLIVNKKFLYSAGREILKSPDLIKPDSTIASTNRDKLLMLHRSLSTVFKNGGWGKNRFFMLEASRSLYREIERNIKFAPAVNVKDRSPFSIRFVTTCEEARSGFLIFMDENNFSWLRCSPNGDFLVQISFGNYAKIHLLIGLMQEFEQGHYAVRA